MSLQEDIVAPLSVTDFSGRGCADTGSCSMERQWIYQSCQEFGFFQTTTGDHHPFRAFSSLTIINAGAEICKVRRSCQGSRKPLRERGLPILSQSNRVRRSSRCQVPWSWVEGDGCMYIVETEKQSVCEREEAAWQSEREDEGDGTC